MAYTYKILGQSAPSATTNTDVYTVGTGKSAVLSGITVANRGATNATFRIALRLGGAALANQHYIAYDVTVTANDSTPIPGGYTLGAGDVVTVYASNSNLSFNVSGSEIS